MAVDDKRLTTARKAGFGLGLLKGMAVTLKHLFKHNTVIQYPDEKQDLPSRTRGVIALKEENCTVCMLCGRECPDWCIYIDSHKEELPPKREGGRKRKRNVLDRFAIDYALCMYCGICVEVCPYDALFWSREFEYAEYDIRELTHEKERLSDWMATVLPPPTLEPGAEGVGSGNGAAAPGSPPAQPAATASTATAAPAAPATAGSPPETKEAPPEEAATDAEERAEPQPRATAPAEPEAAPAPAEPEAAPAPADEVAAARETTAEPAPEGPAVPQVEVPAAAPPAPTVEPAEDAEAVYREVLQEQLDKGSSPQVAEARAKVARVKAERGIRRGPTPVDVEKPVPSAPTKAEESARPAAASDAQVSGEATPSGAPGATEPKPEQGPVAATPGEAAEAEEPRPQAAAAEEGAGAATTKDAEAAPATTEDPEAAYERVLAEERAKGSSDAVATARAKAARVRAQKSTKGPGA